MLALYMYAAGAQRQVMSVLSTLGLCESYGNLISKNKKRIRATKTTRILVDTDKTVGKESGHEAIQEQDAGLPTGSLYQLSRRMREETRQIAATGLYGSVYDNINMEMLNAEDIIGRHSKCFYLIQEI